jgi:glycosyltransferase involved in cell wall biosynthesis
MTVSAALIVKNEERVLGRCLDSFRHAVDEIIVLDTGSTDKTIEIARSRGAKVFEWAWRDDFGLARQEAMNHATSDWVFWVDADDVLLNPERIRSLTDEQPDDVGAIFWQYVFGRDGNGNPTFTYWRERCVRNNGSYKWVGRVHEVMMGPPHYRHVRNEEVIFDHQPDPEKPDRPGRNLRILDAEYHENGGTLEPRMMFYYGRELIDSGQVERGIEILEDYLKTDAWIDERYIALIQIGRLREGRREYDLAEDAYFRAIRLKPRWPNGYFGLAAVAYFRQDWPVVIHWAEIGAALPMPDTTLFIDRWSLTFGWIIYYTNALYNTGRLLDAMNWTRRALEISPTDQWHLHNIGLFEQSPLLQPADAICVAEPSPALAG